MYIDIDIDIELSKMAVDAFYLTADRENKEEN